MPRFALVATFALLAACSKSEPPAPAAPSPAAPESSETPASPSARPKPAINPANNPAAMAKITEEISKAAGVQPGAAKAVNWRELLPLLPDEAAGWKAKAAGEGRTVEMGALSQTEVERTYAKGATEAKVKIIDT